MTCEDSVVLENIAYEEYGIEVERRLLEELERINSIPKALAGLVVMHEDRRLQQGRNTFGVLRGKKTDTEI